MLVACGVALASAVVAKVTFLLVGCNAFDDTGGGSSPAYDSPQGRICAPARYDIWLPHTLVDGVILAAGLLGVVLVILAWRRGGWGTRILGLVGLVVLPLLAVVPLSLPSDTCTAEVRRSPNSNCATEN